jgi:hypothetical protein
MCQFVVPLCMFSFALLSCCVLSVHLGYLLRGSIVVKALCYQPEGRRFDIR